MQIQDIDSAPLVWHSAPYTKISLGTNNASVVKASLGRLSSLVAINTGSTVRYLKFYDKATNPDPTSDTPVLIYPIPANTGGAGVVLSLPKPITFQNGISFLIVSGVANNSNAAAAANEVVVTLSYE